MDAHNSTQDAATPAATPTAGGGLRTLYARVSPDLLRRVKVQSARGDEAMQCFVKRAIIALLEKEEQS